MSVTNMVRDVATRWNSTFDMLEYSLNHRAAINQITQLRDHGLRKFELSDEEWKVVEQLHDVLKVCESRCLHVVGA